MASTQKKQFEIVPPGRGHELAVPARGLTAIDYIVNAVAEQVAARVTAQMMFHAVHQPALRDENRES